MYELALFSGAGGGILGGILCGHTCIGACEIEEYPRKVLLARQRDGLLPIFPIWDDIRTFRSDNKECAEFFDFCRSIKDELVISGGFPCQDISAARQGTKKGRGDIKGKQSSLWGEMYRIVDEIRPKRVFVENSSMLVGRGLAVVLGNFTKVGYDAKWITLGGDSSGSQSKRRRCWILAHANEERLEWTHYNKKEAERFQQSSSKRFQDGVQSSRSMLSTSYFQRRCDGVDNWVDRLKAIGNGQDPAVAKLAWDILNN